jgi:uncharacterized OB-fold protein
MSRGVPLQVCAACGSRYCPHRLACSRCGGRAFSSVVADEGLREVVTTVRRAPGGLAAGPVVIGTVHVRDGPRMVARVDGDLEPGDVVRLSLEHDAPVASAAEASR